MPPLLPKPRRIPKALVAKHVHNLAKGKELYKKADVALDEALTLLPRCGSCGGVMVADIIVKLRNGKKFKLIDKFAEKHRTNVGQNARRFEFEEIPSA
jgi:hypothetical protein